MSQGLRVSASGIRGEWGSSLHGLAARKMGARLRQLVGEGVPIAVGVDGRTSAAAFRQALFDGLTEPIIDLGLVPTPTVLLATRHQDWGGAAIITASHNPEPWNGLKLITSAGKYHSAAFHEDVASAIDAEDLAFEPSSQAREPYAEALAFHLKTILDAVDRQSIAEAKFTVLGDLINGSATVLTPLLLQEFGVTADFLNEDVDQAFAHHPEPRLDNLTDLVAKLKTSGADLGFAQDPDADRLMVLSGDGTPIDEETTLALLLDHALSKEKSDIAVNLSTSRLADHVAAVHGVKVHRTPVGEAHVLNTMLERDLQVGGEGNGGFLFPRMNYGRDSFLALAFILEGMAQRKKSLSAWAKTFPVFHRQKLKLALSDTPLDQIYAACRDEFGPADYDNQDGLRGDLPAGWFHARPSNTEPALRLFVEGDDASWVEEITSRLKQRIQAKATTG